MKALIAIASILISATAASAASCSTSTQEHGTYTLITGNSVLSIVNTPQFEITLAAEIEGLLWGVSMESSQACYLVYRKCVAGRPIGELANQTRKYMNDNRAVWGAGLTTIVYNSLFASCLGEDRRTP